MPIGVQRLRTPYSASGDILSYTATSSAKDAAYQWQNYPSVARVENLLNSYTVYPRFRIFRLNPDETVKETVESAYKMQLVENQIEEETRPYLENKDYEIKDLNEEYIEKIVKRSFTGDFSDTDDSTASPSATACPFVTTSNVPPVAGRISIL